MIFLILTLIINERVIIRTEQLEEIKAFQDLLINTVSSGICILDSNDKVRNFNPSLRVMMGFKPGEEVDKTIFELFPDTYSRTLRQYKNEIITKGKIRFETYLLKNDKTTFPAEIYVSALRNKSGKINSAVAVINDITERKKAELALKRKSEEQALLLDNTDIQIWYMKDPETYGSVNNAHALNLGIEKIFIENQKIYNIYENEEVADSLISANRDTFNNKKGRQFEIEYTSKAGSKKVLNISSTPKLDRKGDVEYIICTAEDVTTRKEAEAKIIYLSYHDKLTGLYNRAFFEDELKRLDSHSVLPLSIIIGDINGLKIANDVFGHDEGDKLLVRIAGILKESCRKGDIVARWGGDEFALILPYTSEDDALDICKTISERCIESNNGLIISNIALGVSTRDDMQKDTAQMIKEAEDRMYRHKLLENRSSRSSYVSLLEKTLFERNYETDEHAKRMCELSVKMGKFIGLPDNKLDELTLLAALHDIGKIAIPDNILLKPGPLTEDEFDIMKKHPEIGYRIAVLSPELTPIADAILTHHERWDGKGYPQGLIGDEIQVISRIISIVDTFDVMTHKRPYKDAVSKEEALNEIRRCAGNQFDPELAEIFIELIEKGDK
jgi:diguanylate cyclase (GGDEF)-like protein/PAS domain S-box-containing protein